MILNILPDLLRGGVSAICALCLFPVLARPKIKVRSYVLLAILLSVVDTIICGLFYINKNYTAVLYFTLGVYFFVIIFL